MTKAELLAEIAAQDFVDWVGVPVLVNTHEDGSNEYQVPIRQLIGNVGGPGKVEFLVVDEEQSGEFAFYKNTVPLRRARPSAIKEWFVETKDANPNNFKAASIIWASERWEEVVYVLLTGTPLAPKYFHVRRNQGASVEITFGSALERDTFLNAIRAGLFQV